jgi:presenilin-like A22 family membrane protease
MKYRIKIVAILLTMFFLTQLIGIAVINSYSPQTKQITQNGEIVNITTHNLPYGLEPPQDINPRTSLFSIIIAFAIALTLMLFLMKYKAELFLRLWFFFVVTLAISITLNAISLQFGFPTIIALVIALPLAFIKIFKRNIIVHNLTELAIYPGIAAIFVPLLNIWAAVILLIIISAYDVYAVWHSGFMIRMAKYQMQKVKIFAGFFVPHTDKKQKQNIAKFKKSNSKSLKTKKIKVNVAILGGGDVVFPLILAGVALRQNGIFAAILIAIGATIALAALFHFSKKGKFYPAMPFITAGAFAGLILSYLIY